MTDIKRYKITIVDTETGRIILNGNIDTCGDIDINVSENGLRLNSGGNGAEKARRKPDKVVK